MKRWLLITNSPDGVYHWLDDAQVAALAADPIRYASVRTFVDGEFVGPEPLSWLWPPGAALLLRVQPVVPEPVVPEPVAAVVALPLKKAQQAEEQQ